MENELAADTVRAPSVLHLLANVCEIEHTHACPCAQRNVRKREAVFNCVRGPVWVAKKKEKKRKWKRTRKGGKNRKRGPVVVAVAGAVQCACMRKGVCERGRLGRGGESVQAHARMRICISYSPASTMCRIHIYTYVYIFTSISIFISDMHFYIPVSIYKFICTSNSTFVARASIQM